MLSIAYTNIKKYWKKLNIQHDTDYVFDMEKPFKMADVLVLDKNGEAKIIETDTNYHEILEFLKLRKTLENAGFVETITQTTSEMLKIEDLKMMQIQNLI